MSCTRQGTWRRNRNVNRALLNFPSLCYVVPQVGWPKICENKGENDNQFLSPTLVIATYTVMGSEDNQTETGRNTIATLKPFPSLTSVRPLSLHKYVGLLSMNYHTIRNQTPK